MPSSIGYWAHNLPCLSQNTARNRRAIRGLDLLARWMYPEHSYFWALKLWPSTPLDKTTHPRQQPQSATTQPTSEEPLPAGERPAPCSCHSCHQKCRKQRDDVFNLPVIHRVFTP